MTDYLELLLDGQEREETEEAPGMELGVFGAVGVRTEAAADIFGRPAVRGGPAGVSGTVQNDTERVRADTAGSGYAEAGETMETGDGTGAAGAEVPVRESVLSVLRFRPDGLARDGGGPDAAGSSLYRRMVRAGQAVGGLRQNTRVLTVTENTAPSPSPGAAELDEIFARDARRYDGGFSLY